ncbi:cupin domain-containing protein [Weissella soli]|uniref:cupin domain-containing protein n=1 Tax=Weissella soli TaxID=155866 RepID=UPI00359F8C9C
MTDNKLELKDFGPSPFAVNLSEAAKQNTNYRTTFWTGNHFQVTLMAIPPHGGDIGMEIHHGNDQFIYLVEGVGHVQMGTDKEKLTVDRDIYPGEAVIIPDNTWHNIINAGDEMMKCYSIYSPVKHDHGVTEATKEEAITQEGPLEGTNE